MKYKLILSNRFEECPMCWQRFVDMLEREDAPRDLGGFTVESINKHLEFYNAEYFDVLGVLDACTIIFDTEQDATAFKLTFGL